MKQVDKPPEVDTSWGETAVYGIEPDYDENGFPEHREVCLGNYWVSIACGTIANQPPTTSSTLRTWPRSSDLFCFDCSKEWTEWIRRQGAVTGSGPWRADNRCELLRFGGGRRSTKSGTAPRVPSTPRDTQIGRARVQTAAKLEGCEKED